jgi:hypothetical protein
MEETRTAGDNFSQWIRAKIKNPKATGSGDDSFWRICCSPEAPP